MKQLAYTLLYLLALDVYGQATFVVDNFSKDYFGQLFIADTSAIFSRGWVAIYDKKTKSEIIKIHVEELTFSLHHGKVLANVKEIPYGEQSQILYDDYNFDGMKDFAIMDGQNSCYHGPSFQIYLATTNGFKHSPEFTTLAQEYCGMFDLNPKTKTIHTMTKSGCCWHQFSTFNVVNNKPTPIKIVEEEMSPAGITWNYVAQNLIKGKMVTSTYKMLALEVAKDDVVLSFKFENKKKMQLFKSGTILYYSFTDANDKIELLYHDLFHYSILENNLTFTHHNTAYIIYDDKIIAKTPNKTCHMKAVNHTIFGTLKSLKNTKIDNLNH
jgi:hypothetical protein